MDNKSTYIKPQIIAWHKGLRPELDNWIAWITAKIKREKAREARGVIYYAVDCDNKQNQETDNGQPIGAGVLAAWKIFTKCLELYAMQADMESAEDMAVYCIMQDGIARKGLERWKQVELNAKAAALPARFYYYIAEAKKCNYINEQNQWTQSATKLHYFLYMICRADIDESETKPIARMARFFGIKYVNLKSGMCKYKDVERCPNGTKKRPRQDWWDDINEIIDNVCKKVHIIGAPR